MPETTYLTKFLQRNLNSQRQSNADQDIKHVIYARSKWLEHEVDFAFLLTTNNKNYRGRLSNDEIKLAADELDRNYKEFYDECKKALTVGITQAGFDYELDADSLVFKLIKCEGFEILYLDVKLREVANCFDMLDTAIELITDGRQSFENTSGTGDEDANQQSLQEYEDYVKESKKQHRKILQKFILLLNSKKEKINELEEKIQNLPHSRSTANCVDSDDNKQVKENSNDAEVTEDCDETVYLEETEAMTPPRTQNVAKRTENLRLDIDDSTDED